MKRKKSSTGIKYPKESILHLELLTELQSSVGRDTPIILSLALISLRFRAGQKKKMIFCTRSTPK